MRLARGERGREKERRRGMRGEERSCIKANLLQKEREEKRIKRDQGVLGCQETCGRRHRQCKGEKKRKEKGKKCRGMWGMRERLMGQWKERVTKGDR